MASPRPNSPEALVESLGGELDAIGSALSEVRSVLLALPGLMKDHVDGAPDEEQSLVVGVLAEPGSIAALWERLDGDGACFVLPDARALAELPPPTGARRRVRVIVGDADADATESAADVTERLGLDLRSLHDPPSWFAVDGDRCGYPASWTPERPAQLLVLHDSVAAGGFQALFEQLWRRAAPPDARRPEWEPVLRQLELGRSEPAIAAALHLSERTVRRRIQAASSALGARNRFTLGVAWADAAGRQEAP